MLGYASQLPDLGGSLEGKSENSVLEFLFRPRPALRPRGSYPTSLSIRVPRGDGNESRWEAQRAEHSPAKDLAWRGPSGRSRLGARLVSGAAPSLSSEHTCFGSAIPPASDAQQSAGAPPVSWGRSSVLPGKRGLRLVARSLSRKEVPEAEQRAGYRAWPYLAL